MAKSNLAMMSKISKAIYGDKPRPIPTTDADRLFDIVARHSGVTGNDPVTLKALGEEYKVGRERIRQLFSLGLNRVRHGDYDTYVELMGIAGKKDMALSKPSGNKSEPDNVNLDFTFRPNPSSENLYGIFGLSESEYSAIQGTIQKLGEFFSEEGHGDFECIGFASNILSSSAASCDVIAFILMSLYRMMAISVRKENEVRNILPTIMETLFSKLTGKRIRMITTEEAASILDGAGVPLIHGGGWKPPDDHGGQKPN